MTDRPPYRSRRESGKLLEVPILFALLVLLLAGLLANGFHWGALAGVAALAGILLVLALTGMLWAAAAEALTRKRTARALDKLLAGEPAESIVNGLGDVAPWILRDEILRRDELFALATRAAPSRAATLRLLVCSADEPVHSRLRPQVRAHLDLLDEAEFGHVLDLFLRETADVQVAADFLARATPAVRHKLLRQLVGTYGVARIRDARTGWIQTWRPVMAAYREDLLAIRDPARTMDVEAIDALLSVTDS